MIKLKKMHVGILALALLTGVSIVVQAHTITHAANTITSNYEIITVNGTNGQPVNTTGGQLSGDGNVLVFGSAASNLPDANGVSGLYAYNIKTASLVRVDVSTSGVLANGSVGSFKVSETGQYVLFVSTAQNLMDSMPNATPYGVYKRDLQNGITTIIANGVGNPLSQNLHRPLGVSDDGRFTLLASRYISNSYPYSYGIIYSDWKVGGNVQLAKGSEIEGSDAGTSTTGNLSCDGSFAVYAKSRSVELADLRRGEIKTSIVGLGDTSSPLISCNGRYVLYATTNRTDITPTPTGMDSKVHLVRYDRITGERIYVDSDSSGAFLAGYAINTLVEPAVNIYWASVADTGDVVFARNGNSYLKHLSDGSGTLEPIAKDTNGAMVNMYASLHIYTRISSDGRYISFVMDPYKLGLTPAPSGDRLIRVKTGL